jgi:hypothetical protein
MPPKRFVTPGGVVLAIFYKPVSLSTPNENPSQVERR